MEHYAYLFLDLFTLSFPLARSFESRIRFVQYWPGIFGGVIAMMALFVPWDMWFTAKGIWGFNPEYITGIHCFGLPIEEWMFFVVVPFACVFIHEVLAYFFPISPLARFERKIAFALMLLSFIISVVYVGNLYTFLTFSLLCVALTIAVLRLPAGVLGRFFFTYILVLLPFTLVNGALTGLFTQAPVVWYNNAENLNLRALSIPFDDFGYNMLMLLIVIGIHETFKAKKRVHRAVTIKK